MACTMPTGILMVPAGSAKGGMKAGAHVEFYVPPTAAAKANKYPVYLQWQAEPAQDGLEWWLTNSSGGVLDHEVGITGTKEWSLGVGDPHTLWFATSYNIFGIDLPQGAAYGLSAACTTPQPASSVPPTSANPCSPNPCGAGCTCTASGNLPDCNCPQAGGSPPGGGSAAAPSSATGLIVVAGVVAVGAVLLVHRGKSPRSGVNPRIPVAARVPAAA